MITSIRVMLPPHEVEVVAEAVERYGERAQLFKALEELGELSAQLARYLNFGNRTAKEADHLCEEIADVEIVLEAVQCALAVRPRVGYWINRKIRRLKRRMNSQRSV